MRQYRPKGRRLPALERNILKYRAFEMVLVLFRIEHLKKFVLNSVRATYSSRFPPGAKNVYRSAWTVLVADGVITQAESAEIQHLIDYRNAIAHNIRHMTGDLSRDPVAEDYAEFWDIKYDYTALRKVKQYHAKIVRAMRSKYIFSASPDRLVFEAAEKTYEQELQKLEAIVNRQIALREKETVSVNAEIVAKEGLLNQIEPDHPLNVARNGTLTERGVQACYRLFHLGMSTFVVSYVMHVSYRAISARRRAWELSGHPSPP